MPSITFYNILRFLIFYFLIKNLTLFKTHNLTRFYHFWTFGRKQYKYKLIQQYSLILPVCNVTPCSG